MFLGSLNVTQPHSAITEVFMGSLALLVHLLLLFFRYSLCRWPYIWEKVVGVKRNRLASLPQSGWPAFLDLAAGTLPAAEEWSGWLVLSLPLL